MFYRRMLFPEVLLRVKTVLLANASFLKLGYKSEEQG